MIIAITSTGPDLSSNSDNRFGRANYIILYDTDTGKYESIDNSSNIARSQGAGIKCAEMLVDKGVDYLITGNCGPNAFRVLSSSGIKVYTTQTESVENIIQKFKTGKINQIDKPNTMGHW